MRRPRRPPRLLLVVAAVLLAVLAATASAATVAPPCASSTLATVEAVDSAVANSVYGGELEGGEVIADSSRVTSSAALVRAVARDDAAAALAVVKKIVYHPLWHIVRLEVLDAAGQILATYGGRYVLAPVSGTLESDGRAVGSYVMSVQDDIGFAKLETRFVGDPIALYDAGARVAELGASLPATPPPGPVLELHGTSYAVVTENYRAIPLGPLEAVILVPPPAAALAAAPCVAVHAQETARVVRRIAARYPDLAASYHAFVETASSYTGATVIVRTTAATIAAGAGPVPPTLPTSGPLTDSGQQWWVCSFDPTRRARVYVLVPVPATT